MLTPSVRAAAALAAAALLLTACSGAGDTAPAAKPTPTRHPVFDQKLDRQLLLAVRRTKQAGTASFTHRLTFASGKGDAVQTMSGRMDFTGGRGRAKVVWKAPTSLPQEARDVLTGTTAGSRSGALTGTYLVGGDRIDYRADGAPYWIRYTSADTQASQENDVLEHLHGTEAPVGGTLLEGLSGAEATQRTDGPGGRRVYRGGMPVDTVDGLFPAGLRRHTTRDNTDVLPVTVTLDEQGRILDAHADLTPLLRKHGDALSGFTKVTMDLTLGGYGTSAPKDSPAGTVRTAAKDVLPLRDVREDGCADFDTGQRLAHLVVGVPCSGPYDVRVVHQLPLGPGGSAEDTQFRADTACSFALDASRPSWMPAKAETWAWWTPEPQGGAGKGRVTCYLTNDRDNA
ncbi:hypothetical protein ACGFRB_07200 [Streptomyces sp. NPDC048718]|uniref:hypothetical protein n=1 Tax=Streptomyces sp. NPDC048718 TaxID=3365587 RepID=UPI003715D628